MQRQQGQAGYTQAGFTQQQQQQVSEGGASMQFLDLDATRAYALGVHQVMLKLEQGMQSLHSQSGPAAGPPHPEAAPLQTLPAQLRRVPQQQLRSRRLRA
jgi:hypothetical protein